MRCVLKTPRAVEWLDNSSCPKVLNVFEQALNLVNNIGEVLSIVTTSIGPGPFSLILAGALPPGIHPDMAVGIDPADMRLKVGPFFFETKDASIWNPIPPWSNYRQTPPIVGELNLSLPQNISNSLGRLLAAVDQGDLDACRQYVHALAGLGQGLTPTGDDVLMGVLYGLWVWRPEERWMRLIVDTAVLRTTTLSAAYLQAAAVGEATYHWHDLVNGKVGAVHNILDIGHSSGADALAGFLQVQNKLKTR